MRVRKELKLACVAAASVISFGLFIVFRSPVPSPSDADNAGITIPIRPAVSGKEEAPQFTPSDLRRGFLELPRRRLQPRAPQRPGITRFAGFWADMDLSASAG